MPAEIEAIFNRSGLYCEWFLNLPQHPRSSIVALHNIPENYPFGTNKFIIRLESLKLFGADILFGQFPRKSWRSLFSATTLHDIVSGGHRSSAYFVAYFAPAKDHANKSAPILLVLVCNKQDYQRIFHLLVKRQKIAEIRNAFERRVPKSAKRNAVAGPEKLRIVRVLLWSKGRHGLPQIEISMHYWPKQS